MLRFEAKKIFSKTKNKIAVAVLFLILILTSLLTIYKIDYVDGEGNHSSGISAARSLREVKNEWAGYLTSDVLRRVIEENERINHSEEAASDDIEEQNKAYAQKQGILGILEIISQAFSPYREYDYYAADRVSTGEAGSIYQRRISDLKDWLNSGKETFSENQKDFLIAQYEKLKTPFYYEYADGWENLLQDISTFILMLALVIGFLVSGIFSDEFQVKADAVFFSTRFGRNRGVLSKMGAGFLITTVFYAVFVLLYTGIVLGALGFDGGNCPVQLDLWRSVYNVTMSQAWLFIVAGGYIGTLFAAILAMLISAITRSTPTAIIVPFVLLCALPFLSRIISLPGFCSFFPDQLLEIYLYIKDPGLVEIGGKVTTIPLVIIPAYAILCLIFQPFLFQIYSRKEIK